MASISDFYNEAGEPLTDGESMRREMYYDSLYEPDVDSFYDHPGWDNDGDEPFCDRCGEYGHWDDECQEYMSDWDDEPSWDGYLGEE